MLFLANEERIANNETEISTKEELEALTEKYNQEYADFSSFKFCTWRILGELMKEHFGANRDSWAQNWDTPVLQIQMDYFKSIRESVETFVDKQAQIYAENPYTNQLIWSELFDAYKKGNDWEAKTQLRRKVYQKFKLRPVNEVKKEEFDIKLEENPNNPGILQASTVEKNEEESDPLGHVNRLPPEWRPKVCVKPLPDENYHEFVRRRIQEIKNDEEKLPFNTPKFDYCMTRRYISHEWQIGQRAIRMANQQTPKATAMNKWKKEKYREIKRQHETGEHILDFNQNGFDWEKTRKYLRKLWKEQKPKAPREGTFLSAFQLFSREQK